MFMNELIAEVGSSALYVAAATFSVAVAALHFRQCSGSCSARYLSSDSRFCRYSATATFIDKAFRFYLIVLNII